MGSDRAVTLPSAEELQARAARLLADWRVPDAAIDVVWNDRLKTSAGRAFVRHGRIELNPHLLGRAPEQVPMVLTHEVAHVAAARLFGVAIPAHGRHWRSLMRLAGFPPKVTHDIPIEPRHRVRSRRRRHLYLRVCDGCGDRRILASVRYGRCQGCDARDRFLVLRAAANPAGRRALEKLSLDDVRAKCTSSILPGDW